MALAGPVPKGWPRADMRARLEICPASHEALMDLRDRIPGRLLEDFHRSGIQAPGATVAVSCGHRASVPKSGQP